MKDNKRNLPSGWLQKRLPFIEELLSIEHSFENFIFEDNNDPNLALWKLNYVEVELTAMRPEVLNLPTHKDAYNPEECIPVHRLYTQDSSLPDRLGPVPTYAIKDDKIIRLGLEVQLVDKEYIEDGYEAQARLKDPAQTIRESLKQSKVPEPDFLVLRNRDHCAIRFEIMAYR